jgi:hypothetical protein
MSQSAQGRLHDTRLSLSRPHGQAESALRPAWLHQACLGDGQVVEAQRGYLDELGAFVTVLDRTHNLDAGGAPGRGDWYVPNGLGRMQDIPN